MPNLAGVLRFDSETNDMAKLCDRLMRIIALPVAPGTASQWHDENFACVNIVLPRLGDVQQPARSKRGRRLLFIDGYVVNDGDLREENREDVGAGPPSTSVADLCMKLYERYGASFVERLEGHFNIVIYDCDTKRVTLLNDRFGYRPLYYCMAENAFVFALERKAILATVAKTRCLDEQGTAELLAFGHNLDNRTIFKDVLWLPPASVATVDGIAPALTIHRYWTPRYTRGGCTDLREYASELGRRLLSATHCWANRTERIGLFLSGGLDSRAVAACLARTGRAVTAFSFGDADHPDVRYGQQIAARLGFSHQQHACCCAGYAIAGPRVVWRTEAAVPFHNCTSIQNHPAVYAVADIVFNGHFGDAVSGGHLLPQHLVIHNRSQLVSLILAKRSVAYKGAFARLFRPDFVRTAVDRMRESVARSIESFAEDRLPFLYNLWDLTVRQSRFTFSSPAVDRYLFEQTSPFLNSAVVSFALTVPLRYQFLQRAYTRMILDLEPRMADIPWTRTNYPIPSGLLSRVWREVLNQAGRRLAQRQRPGGPGRGGPGAVLHLQEPTLYRLIDDWCHSDALPDKVLDRDGTMDITRRYFAGEAALEDEVGTLLTLAWASRLFIEGDLVSPPREALPPLCVS